MGIEGKINSSDLGVKMNWDMLQWVLRKVCHLKDGVMGSHLIFFTAGGKKAFGKLEVTTRTRRGTHRRGSQRWQKSEA